jgi:hypothetical protein
MTGPRAAVRITVAAYMLADHGGINDLALRSIRGRLAGVPDRARITVDLGPLRSSDELLILSLAVLPCANLITFESSDWRVAQRAALKLTEVLADQGVA